MFDELNDLYQQVILDHCKHPRNFHELPNPTCSAQGHNPLCGDQLKLFLTMDGETVKDAGFLGSGCCISKASASLLTESVKGKTKAEIQKLFEQVHDMVHWQGERGRGQTRRVCGSPQVSSAGEVRYSLLACGNCR